MTPSRLNRVLLALYLCSANYDANAFTTNIRSNALRPLNNLRNNQPNHLIQWRMVDDKSSSSATEEATKVESNNRPVAFDSKSGRLSFGNEEECIPDDEYCVVDNKTGKLIRLTIEEKERIFLDALQSYYVSGRQLLADAEFDLLKEDLSWNGSKVINMNRKEAKYLDAVQAYLKGKPVMSDEEYNTLKQDLKDEKSKFAVSKEPKCYIDTGICTVTFSEDKFRSNLLYLPAGLICFVVWIGVGFEIVNVFAKINPLVLSILGSPLYYYAAKQITENYIFQDKKVLYGPCPTCEVENRVYFGKIFGLEGFDDVAEIKCCDKKCKSIVRIQKDSSRASTLPK